MRFRMDTCQAVFAAAGQPDALFPCWDWGRGGSDRVVPAAVFPLRAHSHRHPVECGLLCLLAIDLFVVPLAGEGILLNLLSLVSVGIRMMLPCIITGAYAFSTTTIGELTAALRRMHVPESVIIPCAVVVRFFPTVQEDYHQIHNAMALRGIAEGKGALLLHPMQSLEYILMPLLMNGNNVAQDLSVAALTKGIGLPGTHTCMTELHLTVWDFIYPALCTLPLLWKGGILL